MSRIVTIELDWDDIDKIVIEELERNKEELQQSLEMVKKDGRGIVFTGDQQQDIVEIEKHISACDVLIQYYKPIFTK